MAWPMPGLRRQQPAVGNAAKAALATLGPVGRTHQPALPLARAVGEGAFPRDLLPDVHRLAACPHARAERAYAE